MVRMAAMTKVRINGTDSLRAYQLCRRECLCYKCARDCDRCDGCGEENFVGHCDRFVKESDSDDDD